VQIHIVNFWIMTMGCLEDLHHFSEKHTAAPWRHKNKFLCNGSAHLPDHMVSMTQKTTKKKTRLNTLPKPFQYGNNLIGLWMLSATNKWPAQIICVSLTQFYRWHYTVLFLIEGPPCIRTNIKCLINWHLQLHVWVKHIPQQGKWFKHKY